MSKRSPTDPVIRFAGGPRDQTMEEATYPLPEVLDVGASNGHYVKANRHHAVTNLWIYEWKTWATL